MAWLLLFSLLSCKDLDGDGYGWRDCDDDDASIHPYAFDLSWDGIDADCSGEDSREGSMLAATPTGSEMCALDNAKHIRCWGFTANPPQGSFAKLAFSWTTACALDHEGIPVCWDGHSGTDLHRLAHYDWINTGTSWVDSKVHGSKDVRFYANGSGETTCRVADGVQESVGGRYFLHEDGSIHDIVVDDYEHRCSNKGVLDFPGDFVELVWLHDGTGLCGRSASGEVTCMDGTSLEERFVDIVDGFSYCSPSDCFYQCGLHVDGSVSCWGDLPEELVVPEGSGHRALALAEYGEVCVVTATGEVACSFTDRNWESYARSFRPPAEVVQLEMNLHRPCVIDVHGQITCWQATESPPLVIPDVAPVKLEVGEAQACALDEAGEVSCWGSNPFGKEDPFQGSYLDVEVGYDLWCAEDQSGEWECHREYTDTLTSQPWNRTTAVSMSKYHACWLNKQGQPDCEGWLTHSWSPETGYEDGWGLATTPAGVELGSISTGLMHTCGLDPDGTVICWGDDSYGQSSAPEGRFTSVEAGGYHSCGIRGSGELECWGWDYFGQATPPSGVGWLQVVSGRWHSCALDANSELRCWGANESGQLSPN